MARRLTTNQEIAGSIPASVTMFLLGKIYTKDIFFSPWAYYILLQFIKITFATLPREQRAKREKREEELIRYKRIEGYLSSCMRPIK